MSFKRAKILPESFSKEERFLWGGSAALIAIAFFAFDRGNYLTLFASLAGVTSLIFNAKGNPIGPLFMVGFSVLYGVISFGFAYYGEMITYLGMTAPMSAFALASWLKNPYSGDRAEVKINRLKKKELLFMLQPTALITFAFYGILAAFHTNHLIPSTLSVTTSFLAVYLTFRRSALYAAAYAANDLVLIFLWVLAMRADIAYVSVVICFAVFLVNDIYGFISWLKMQRRQEVGA